MNILYGKGFAGWAQSDITLYEECASARSSFEHWFPLVEPFARVPKSAVFRMKPSEYYEIFNFESNDMGIDSAIKCLREIALAIGEFARSEGMISFFLKRDDFSGKHEWAETCFVPSTDANTIAKHMIALVYEAEYNEVPPKFGFVARRIIPTHPVFSAFKGFPVTRERRYFVRDGRVEFHHPYWPPDSISQPSKPEWRDLLENVNRETDEEIATLTFLSNHAAQELGDGYWSMDWLCDESGNWWLIDMADGDMSFRWHDYVRRGAA